MGTISSARAIYGLNAAGTPTGTNITGTSQIGVAQTSQAFADADIAYSFKVTSTAGSDVATLTIASGLVAQTTGIPTITDGDGKDFEGETLATIVTPLAILVSYSVTAGSEITVTSSDASNPGAELNADGIPLLAPLNQLGTIAFDITEPGDSVTVTVIGKSS